MISIHRGHYVRLGPLGTIGKFGSNDPVVFPRGARVICRTQRGLEIGDIVAAADEDQTWRGAHGTIIRSMTPEDEFVWQRLTSRRDEAFERCQDLLKAHDRTALLIDAEILFDAKSIFFYFLGEPPQQIESLLTNLGERFEAEIEFAKFVDAVETGCGPGCGTDEAVGCGDHCASCAVAQACKK